VLETSVYHRKIRRVSIVKSFVNKGQMGHKTTKTAGASQFNGAVWIKCCSEDSNDPWRFILFMGCIKSTPTFKLLDTKAIHPSLKDKPLCLLKHKGQVDHRLNAIMNSHVKGTMTHHKS